MKHHPTLELLNWLLDEPVEVTEMTMQATFARIAEDTERSAHDRLVEAVQVYKIEHPETDELTAQRAVFTALPKLHREYLDSNL